MPILFQDVWRAPDKATWAHNVGFLAEDLWGLSGCEGKLMQIDNANLPFPATHTSWSILCYTEDVGGVGHWCPIHKGCWSIPGS